MDNNIEIDPKILEEIDNRLHTFQNDKDKEDFILVEKRIKENYPDPESKDRKDSALDNLDKKRIRTIKKYYSQEDNEVFFQKITALLSNIDKAINNKTETKKKINIRAPSTAQTTYTLITKNQNSAVKSNNEYQKLDKEITQLKNTQSDINKLITINTEDEREWNKILNEYTSANVLNIMNKDREPANTNSQLDVFGKNYDEQVQILKDRIKEWWKTTQTNFDYKTNGIYRIFNNNDIKSYRFFIENDSLYAYMYNCVIPGEKEMVFDNSKL